MSLFSGLYEEDLGDRLPKKLAEEIINSPENFAGDYKIMIWGGQYWFLPQEDNFTKRGYIRFGRHRRARIRGLLVFEGNTTKMIIKMDEEDARFGYVSGFIALLMSVFIIGFNSILLILFAAGIIYGHLFLTKMEYENQLRQLIDRYKISQPSV